MESIYLQAFKCHLNETRQHCAAKIYTYVSPDGCALDVVGLNDHTYEFSIYLKISRKLLK